MSTIRIDSSNVIGKIKTMNAVNNGPCRSRNDQCSGNFENYKAAKIPYARNHDAAFDSRYGAGHIVDTMFIFRDFDADVNDPANYDFTLTDIYLKKTFRVRGVQPQSYSASG